MFRFQLLIALVLALLSTVLVLCCYAQEVEDPESFGFTSPEATKRLEEKVLFEQAVIPLMASIASKEAEKIQWAFEHYIPTHGEQVTFDWEKRKTFIGGHEFPEDKVTVVFVTRTPKELVSFLTGIGGAYDKTVRAVFIFMQAHDTDEEVMATVFHEFCHVYDIVVSDLPAKTPGTVLEGEYRLRVKVTFPIKTQTLIIVYTSHEEAVAFESSAYLCETAYLAAILERQGVRWRECGEDRLRAELYHHVYHAKGDNAYAGAAWDAFLMKEFLRILDTRVYATPYEDAAQGLWKNAVKFFLENFRRR